MQEVGWNFIAPSSCYGFVSGGVNYLIIYPTIGGFLITSDIVAITTATPYCVSGGSFYIYWNGTAWTQTVLLP